MQKYKLHCGNELVHGDAGETYGISCHRPHLLIYDPPWDITVGFDFSLSNNVLAFCDGYRAKDIINIFGAPSWIFVWDCVSCWYTPNRPLRRGKMCFWYGNLSDYRTDGAFIRDRHDKPRLVSNTRGEYLFRPGGGVSLADVYSSPITRLHAEGHHHAKPQQWVTAIIANTLPEGAVIIDPFAGSGSSLVAARQIGASWVGGDIDIDCVDKILQLSENYAADSVQYDLWVSNLSEDL